MILVFRNKRASISNITYKMINKGIWLVGCFSFNGPLRQYFSLYWAASQREGEEREMSDDRENVQTTPTLTYCKRSMPLSAYNPYK